MRDDPARRQILRPSQINGLARSLLEDAFPTVWVEGELGNLSRPASGHLYFTLKDADAQLRCALFRGHGLRLGFRPEAGQSVLARGRLSLYEARGDYQLIADHLEPAGDGTLRRALEELKTRLASEGLFAAERKRPLPRFPGRIAVLTSASGAAIQDVLKVLARRFPAVQVELFPVPVQGEGAAARITATLEQVYRHQRHDLILLTRGGGSLEDLWAFNDETLARTLARSPIPTISAIGHEIDFSLTDFVADLRAATPSVAAELIVPDRVALAHELEHRRSTLDRLWRRRSAETAQRIDHLSARLNGQRPQQQMQRLTSRFAQIGDRLRSQPRRRLDRLDERLTALARLLGGQRPQRRLSMLAERLRELDRRQHASVRTRLANQGQHCLAVARALSAVSPLATLERGYAIVQRDDDGAVIRSIEQVTIGERVQARLAHGRLHLEVRAIDRPSDLDPEPTSRT